MIPSFDDHDGWIWLDGRFVPWREATADCFLNDITRQSGGWD